MIKVLKSNFFITISPIIIKKIINNSLLSFMLTDSVRHDPKMTHEFFPARPA